MESENLIFEEFTLRFTNKHQDFKRMNETVPVKSLKKALDLLDMLLFEDAEEQGFAVNELAGKLCLPANSVHNLLKTMRICGYVEKNGSGRYTFGPACRRIAYRNYQRGDDFREKVIAVMREAIAILNESMVFTILASNTWNTLVRAEPTGKVVKVDMEEVERRYLFETATGRVMFSYSSLARRSVLIRENGHPEKQWPDYEADSARIRKEGFCMCMRERYGLFTYGVPVFGKTGELIGALGVYTVPVPGYEKRNGKILQTLLESARKITAF